ncbi:MFS transporter [Sedimentibacter sp. zth1]|uniref:MFS transporter n=1 Tax=Sedimentibacter sp. zth1 TaxID=2816908 RepID=UPI001A91466F|nr:MFS transporter [Sedimentibacter sp. zth1]QSX05341.1 MFS transporter [Sedimentibacter sp. zth1]
MKIVLLKDKDFLLLMLGKLVSLIGSDMQSFALSLYVLKITGSATKFASVLSITIIPKLILGPIAGVFTDWLDRKKIIVCFDFLNGVIIGIYAILFNFTGELTMTSIYFLVFILSLTSVVFQPAISTVIPSIVKKDHLIDANGINSIVMSIGSLVAPMIAGILMGMNGMLIIFWVNSISFMLSATSEVFIRIPNYNKMPNKISFKAFKRDFVEGIRYIKNTKIIVVFISIVIIVNFAFNPLFNIGIVFICKEVLKISDFQYGVMQTVLVVSMFIAPILCGYISKKISIGKIVFYNIFFICILSLFIAIISTESFRSMFCSNMVPFILILSICFVVGVILGIINISVGVVVQKNVSLDKLGRVNTVMTTGTMSIIPMGMMFFGFLYDTIPVWLCVTISAIIMFAGIITFKNTLFETEKEYVK